VGSAPGFLAASQHFGVAGRTHGLDHLEDALADTALADLVIGTDQLERLGLEQSGSFSCSNGVAASPKLFLPRPDIGRRVDRREGLSRDLPPLSEVSAFAVTKSIVMAAMQPPPPRHHRELSAKREAALGWTSRHCSFHNQIAVNWVLAVLMRSRASGG
jgi:hypothetical protein